MTPERDREVALNLSDATLPKAEVTAPSREPDALSWALSKCGEISMKIESTRRLAPRNELSFDDFLSKLWEHSLGEAFEPARCERFLQDYLRSKGNPEGDTSGARKVRTISSFSPDGEQSESSLFDMLRPGQSPIDGSAWATSDYQRWFRIQAMVCRIERAYPTLTRLERLALEARVVHNGAVAGFGSFTAFMTGKHNRQVVSSILNAVGRATRKILAAKDSARRKQPTDLALAKRIFFRQELRLWRAAENGTSLEEISRAESIPRRRLVKQLATCRAHMRRIKQNDLTENEKTFIQALAAGESDRRLVAIRCSLSNLQRIRTRRLLDARLLFMFGSVPTSPHLIDRIEGSLLRGILALNLLGLEGSEIAVRLGMDIKAVHSRIASARTVYGLRAPQTDKLAGWYADWSNRFAEPPQVAASVPRPFLEACWSTLSPRTKMALSLHLRGTGQKEVADSVNLTIFQFQDSLIRSWSELSPEAAAEVKAVRIEMENLNHPWHLPYLDPPPLAPSSLVNMWRDLRPSSRMALTHRFRGEQSEEAARKAETRPSNYRHMLADTIRDLPDDVRTEVQTQLKKISLRARRPPSISELGETEASSEGESAAE